MLLWGLLHRLHIIQLVYIQLYDGRWEVTWKQQKNPDGWHSHRFPVMRIAPIQLMKDGTVKGSTYIDRWVEFDEINL